MMRFLPLVGVLFISVFTITNVFAQKVVHFQDERITYSGRIGYQADAAKLFWSGSSMQINFKGTDAKLMMKDERGDNYFNVIIDGKIVVLHPDGQKRTYQLASDLSNGAHSLTIYKRTEWSEGTSLFYGFEFNSGAEILPADQPKKHKIEFYGNSITSGYAIEDFAGGNNSYLPPYKNHWLTYDAITARHFDAQLSVISKSGIGVVVGYTPFTMPEIYNRLDPNDPNSLWDFAKFTPDVIVINLFQNDASITRQPDHPNFKARFGDTMPTDDFIINAYRNFLTNIRGKYPKAQIICVLGNMDAVRESLPWRGYIEKAVAKMNDSNISTHFFAYKNTPGHPSVAEHQSMADDLIKYIGSKMKW